MLLSLQLRPETKLRGEGGGAGARRPKPAGPDPATPTTRRPAVEEKEGRPDRGEGDRAGHGRRTVADINIVLAHARLPHASSGARCAAGRVAAELRAPPAAAIGGRARPSLRGLQRARRRGRGPPGPLSGFVVAVRRGEERGKGVVEERGRRKMAAQAAAGKKGRR